MKGKVKVRCKYYFDGEYKNRNCTYHSFNCMKVFKKLIKVNCNGFKIEWTTYIIQKEHLIKLEE